jgi:hypothetical protein
MIVKQRHNALNRALYYGFAKPKPKPLRSRREIRTALNT